jgi:hypothetical protein
MTSAVDVLVPVHTPERPIARLARSVLATSAPVRLVVVAHNVDPSLIEAALGEYRADARVTVLPFEDGIPSPAGPLRHALEHLGSPFFMKVDSDDYLAEGAIESWTAVQQRFDADIVIPTMRMVGTPRNFPTPPRRPFRTVLDPVHDRLAYRTSTMGLFRSTLAEKAVPTPGLRTAEDLIPSLRLWFSGARIVRSDTRHPYLVASDAGNRVTEAAWTLGEELAFVSPLVEDRLWDPLDARARVSIVAKLLRVQLFPSLARRSGAGFGPTEVELAAGAARRLSDLAPEVRRVLSRNHAALLDELLAGSPDAGRLRTLAAHSLAHGSLGALATSRIRDGLRADAPARYLGASLLARYRR